MAHSDALSADKKVLVLGAGYVSAPLVDYLSRDPKVSITVASALKDEADMLAKKFHNTNSIVIDVERKKDTLDKLLKEHNIVVSLLPYGLHSTIAEMCIKNHVNMVTASYLNPEMKALHNAAEQAGITIINEVGLDPGIDHFLAMECFDDVKTHGGQITSFISWCGGLPAPEDSENPLRYKFSWSPRGVLLNTTGPAKYLKDGKIEEIPAGGALMDNLIEIDFLPGFNLEGFPNRDSLQYADAYGIHFAKSLMRGTLRYKGFCNTIKGLQKLGLIDNENHPSLHPKGPDITWKQVICTLLNQESDILLDSLKSIILDKIDDDSRVEAIDKLGLLSDELVVKLNSPLNTLCHYLNKRLAYADGERDLVVLRHDIGVQWPDMKTEMRRINFVVYGEVNGYTAMAKTVGLPAAIATKMILEGEIQNKGMVLPLSRDIYLPILKRLKQEGIQAMEHVVHMN